MYFILEKKQAAYQVETGHHLSATPHLHTHIEIILVTEGESSGTADEKSAPIEAGDMFVALPNQVHYYIDKTERLNFKMLIVSPDLCPEFSGIFKTMIPESPVMKRAVENRKIVSAIDTIIECRRSTVEYTETEVRGSMLVLLSELFRNVKLVDNVSCDSDAVKDIINYCYENYDSDISLQSVSEALYISRYYISRLFSKRLHIGFNDYINSLRIRKACELLKSGDEPITKIACAVGYSSPRTFNRCFMNIRGMTPKEYRRKAHESKKR